MASTNFTNLCRLLATAGVNWSSVSLKVMLLSSVPSELNLDTWTVRSDVTNEITGTGYTSGGIAQAYTLNALDTANNKQSVTYTNIVAGWTSASFTTAAAIIYVDTGLATTDKLLHMEDFGGSQVVTAADFGITYTGSYDITR